jgi:hypothetical protein
MYVFQARARSGESRTHSWLTVERLVLYSGVMLVLYVIFLALWTWTSHGFTVPDASRPGVDFSIFWSASYVMLHGSPWQVYDYGLFEKVEVAHFDFLHGNFLPWLYPPTFLLLVTPFALLPPTVAFVLFVGVSTLLFVIGALRVSGLASSFNGLRSSWLPVAACPCIFVAAVFGQNSILTGALAAFALYWIDRKPALAGLCIGLLAIKPQMALLFPFVLIAAGAWRAFAAAAVSATLFGSLSAFVCGAQCLRPFLLITSVTRELILEHSGHYWLASPTTFAALRAGGVPLTLAYIGEAGVALIAAAAACHVWKITRDTRLRAAILVVATLIANPYVWHYELAWLGIALACLTSIGFSKGWLRGEQEIIVLAWLLPIYEFFNRVVALPQIGPVVLMLMLLIILRRVRITAEMTR